MGKAMIKLIRDEDKMNRKNTNSQNALHDTGFTGKEVRKFSGYEKGQEKNYEELVRKFIILN